MKSRTDKNFWLYNYPVAHRGLYSNENGIPENTIIAFEEAIKNGYPIEMDIQMSIDGELFCFHDDNAIRICGIDKDVRDMTEEEFRNLRPFGYQYGVMTFKEFLDFVDSRVPLVIEVKNQKRKGIEEKIIRNLEGYKGEYVIQSFNPIIVRNIHKLNKDIIVGVLSTSDYPKTTKKSQIFFLNHFIYKLFVKFDFLNVRIEDLKKYKRHCKGYPTIAWTARDNSQIELCNDYALNVIFEKTCTDLGKYNNNLLTNK